MPLMPPFFLTVGGICLLDALVHLTERRERAPFAGKGGAVYVCLRMAVVPISLLLFAAGAVTLPLSRLCNNLPDIVFSIILFVEVSLLPFTVSAIIYFGLRLIFRLARGNMGNYLDYGVITYYVTMTILAVYVCFMFWGAVLAW
jgi:hypothetical protein